MSPLSRLRGRRLPDQPQFPLAIFAQPVRGLHLLEHLDLALSLDLAPEAKERRSERVARPRMCRVQVHGDLRDADGLGVIALLQAQLPDAGVGVHVVPVHEQSGHELGQGLVGPVALLKHLGQPAVGVAVVGAHLHARLERTRGLVEVAFGQVDPADRLVEMVLTDERVPFGRLLEGPRRVEVPGHQLIQAAQAVVGLAGGGHRGDRGQQRPLRVGVPSGRAVDVGQRHPRPFVGRIQADGRRELHQAVVVLVRLPQRDPEEPVRLGASRLGRDDGLQVLDRERHVPGAEGRAAVDQPVAARGDAAQRVAVEGLPEEVECVGVGPTQ